MKTELSVRGGSNLHYIRKSRGYTLGQLSGMMREKFGIDISESAISRYESGERPITQEMTAQFADCLQCSVATLMDGLDLAQDRTTQTQELRQLPKVVHDIFYWVATKWNGDIVALATAWGLYAATPGKYRKYAMMELLDRVREALDDGAIIDDDIPSCIREGIPTVEELLGGLYDE